MFTCGNSFSCAFEAQPSAQSSFQKLSVGSSCQKHAKFNIFFLKSCPVLLYFFTWFLYFRWTLPRTFISSIKEIHRLLSKGMSNIYKKGTKRTFSKPPFSKFKKLSLSLFVRPPTHADITEFTNFLL